MFTVPPEVLFCPQPTCHITINPDIFIIAQYLSIWSVRGIMVEPSPNLYAVFSSFLSCLYLLGRFVGMSVLASPLCSRYVEVYTKIKYFKKIAGVTFCVFLFHLT